MTTYTPEIRRRARELREAGRLLSEVSEELGVPQGTISNWTNPDYQRKRAERRKRYSGVCVDCGATTNGSNGPGKAPERCFSCHMALRTAAKKWTETTIIASIRAWVARYGAPPTSKEWIRTGVDLPHPPRSAVYRPGGPFPKWADAIEAAGYPRPKVGPRGPRVTREEILERIRSCSKDGVAPTTDPHYPNAVPRHLWTLGVREFGSWKAACAAAGVKTKSQARKESYAR